MQMSTCSTSHFGSIDAIGYSLGFVVIFFVSFLSICCGVYLCMMFIWLLSACTSRGEDRKKDRLDWFSERFPWLFAVLVLLGVVCGLCLAAFMQYSEWNRYESENIVPVTCLIEDAKLYEQQNRDSFDEFFVQLCVSFSHQSKQYERVRFKTYLSSSAEDGQTITSSNGTCFANQTFTGFVDLDKLDEQYASSVDALCTDTTTVSQRWPVSNTDERISLTLTNKGKYDYAMAIVCSCGLALFLLCMVFGFSYIFCTKKKISNRSESKKNYSRLEESAPFRGLH